jgi:hypothetical protein
MNTFLNLQMQASPKQRAKVISDFILVTPIITKINYRGFNEQVRTRNEESAIKHRKAKTTTWHRRFKCVGFY